MMKSFLLVLASTAALLGYGGAQAQVSKSEYRPIVGSNGVNTGFRTIQTPSSLQNAGLGTSYAVKRLDYEVFGDTAGRMKFFLPPGTVAFNANLYYYYVFQEGKVALRLNQPPVTPLSSITPGNAGGSVNESVLRNLGSGQEILYYSAGAPANSLVISSPELPIAPMATGGYVYGNYQYPGDILQRGLLQVFVKADCYEQWFNSPQTQWDAFGNPDENATHTCEGSTGGGNPGPGPGGPGPGILTGVAVSPTSTLDVAAPQTLTLLPEPSTATLPACTVVGSTPYVTITGNQVTLAPAALSLDSLKYQVISCGTVTTTITIKPGNSTRVEKAAPTTDRNGNLVLNLKLVRPASEVAGKANTTVWIGGKIPKDGFFFTEDEWFFLTPQGWTMLTVPNPQTVAYQTNSARTETTYTIPTDLPAADLGHFNVELYFGYVDDNGVFQNEGVVWKK